MIVDKPWGRERIILKWEGYTVKILEVDEGHRTSLQYHNKKNEMMYYEDGRVVFIPPGLPHRLVGPVKVLEVSWNGDDSDIVRLEDDYNRA